MFCTNCGREIPADNMIACPGCGAPTDFYFESRRPPQEQTRKYGPHGARCATAGFILSLISIAAGPFIVPTVAAYILSVTGIICTPPRSNARNRAVAGTIIAYAVQTLLTALLAALFILWIFAAAARGV